MSLTGELDVDHNVAARRVGVGADLVGGGDQRLGLIARQLGQAGLQLDGEAVRLAGGAERDRGGHRDRPGGDLLAPRDRADRAAEARRVAGGEQLLGVGAGRAAAAERLRRDQREIEHAVVGLGAAIAASGGGGNGGVETLVEDRGGVGHGAIDSHQFNCAQVNRAKYMARGLQRPTPRLRDRSGLVRRAYTPGDRWRRYGLVPTVEYGVVSSAPGAALLSVTVN